MKATKSIGYLIIGLLCGMIGIKAMAKCVPFVAGISLNPDKYTAETTLTATANYNSQSVKDSQKFTGSSTIFYFFNSLPTCPQNGVITLATTFKDGTKEDVGFKYQLQGSEYIITCPGRCRYDRCCGTTSKAGNLAVNAGDKKTKVCAGAPLCGP